MTNSTLLGCDLKSLRNKLVVTGSQVLSAKILEAHTHFGAQAHSLRSLAKLLHEHSGHASQATPRGALTSEERELLGESLRAKLSSQNYFKKAFDLPGLRAKVFDCLDELRLAGYEPSHLADDAIENTAKVSSLREIFTLYQAYLTEQNVSDYPVLLQHVVLELQKGRYDSLIANSDLILPFKLDLKGAETSLFEVLAEHAHIFAPESAVDGFRSETGVDSKSLEKFKTSLASFLDHEPMVATSERQPLDSSLVLRASLTRDEALSRVFDWMLSQGGDIGTTALVTLNYDDYAGGVYRFCQAQGIPLNLSQGLLASEFAFFAEDLAALERLHQTELRTGQSAAFTERARTYFKNRQCTHTTPNLPTIYDAFRSQALSFLQSYQDAQKAFPGVELSPSHAWDRLRSELLEARLSLHSLELDRHGLFFGRPEDLIGCQVSHLAVLGLQDHHYPPKVTPDPILTDTERQALNERIEHLKFGHELRLSTPREIQKDLLEKICLGVRNSLYLGFESHDLESGALSLPSSFLNRVLGAFGYPQKAESIYELSGLSETFFSADLAGNPFLSHDAWLTSHDQVGDRFARWTQILSRRSDRRHNTEDGVSAPALAAKLVGRDLSASAIADFFTCPYKFYLRKVAGVAALETDTRSGLQWLDAMERGELIHEVFEKLARVFMAEEPTSARWLNFMKKEAPGILESIISAAAQAFDTNRAGVPAAIIEQELSEIRELASEFIAREIIQVEETGFYPIKVEEPFKELLFSWPDPKNAGQTLTLKFNGAVDRLDTNGKGLYRVLDYKTGKNRHRDNLNLFKDADRYVHFQHAIYGHWAIEQSGFKMKPSDLTTGYYFSSEKGGWDIVEAPYHDYTAQFQAFMTLLHDSITQGHFHKNHAACTGCDFRLVCGGVQTRRRYFAESSPQLATMAECLEGPVSE
ncbi:PD-(D/E)XK nuclease family protein [Bdellovibrionota bacterium FG-1]